MLPDIFLAQQQLKLLKDPADAALPSGEMTIHEYRECTRAVREAVALAVIEYCLSGESAPFRFRIRQGLPFYAAAAHANRLTRAVNRPPRGRRGIDYVAVFDSVHSVYFSFAAATLPREEVASLCRSGDYGSYAGGRTSLSQALTRLVRGFYAGNEAYYEAEKQGTDTLPKRGDSDPPHLAFSLPTKDWLGLAAAVFGGDREEYSRVACGTAAWYSREVEKRCVNGVYNPHYAVNPLLLCLERIFLELGGESGVSDSPFVPRQLIHGTGKERRVI